MLNHDNVTQLLLVLMVKAFGCHATALLLLLSVYDNVTQLLLSIRGKSCGCHAAALLL
jgi:hypothetical protein